MEKEQKKLLDKLSKSLDGLYKTKEWQRIMDATLELKDTEAICCCLDIKRNIDHLAISAGFIYDKINGKPKRGLSVTAKIRKALGYTAYKD